MSWYRLDLGDALLAGGALDDIRRQSRAAFERAGAPPGWAVYEAHISGDLHCLTQVFFSPAAAELARELGARCCGELPESLALLAGEGPLEWPHRHSLIGA